MYTAWISCICTGQKDDSRIHYTIQNVAQFKTYQLFISEIFHVIFLDCNWLWVTENLESKTTDKGELLHYFNLHLFHDWWGFISFYVCDHFHLFCKFLSLPFPHFLLDCSLFSYLFVEHFIHYRYQPQCSFKLTEKLHVISCTIKISAYCFWKKILGVEKSRFFYLVVLV